MIWLTWRQFRGQALAALVVLAAVAAYLLITGRGMHHTYTTDLASCTPQNNCGFVFDHFQHDYQTPFNLLRLLVIAAPGLIGMFWGAPLIAREVETGTNQLAWNQSVTRTLWLTAKLVGVGAASIATAGVLTYLLTWWAGPLEHITGRFEAPTFATRDIVPLGYAAFAFALGTTAGLLLRRTIPAMAATLALFIGIQILVPNVIRPNLLSSTTISYPINQTTPATGIYTQGGGSAIYFAGLPVPPGSWVLSSPPVEDSSNHVVAAYSHLNCFPASPGGATKTKGPNSRQITDCLAGYHLHESITYQPASHYWPLQWYEFGIFLALAGALSGICFWQIRRRQS
jgi:ABC-type transport system involved in multi-copper enzyme maturation permease subunit